MRIKKMFMRFASFGAAVLLSVTMTPAAFHAAAESVPAAGLSIPAVFAVTRPEKELATTYASYFITGTSDPGMPVYFEGEEIERLGTKGTFGVYVDLELGENRFKFSQGGETATVLIERKAESGPAPIRDITASSMIPRYFSGAEAGGSLTVGCTAPAGATVTASFGGRKVTLTPAAEGVKAGLPQSYTGKLTLGLDYERGVTRRAGKVRYELSYGGETKAYESSGEVYVAGEGGRIAVEVAGYLGFVYPALDQLGSIKETVRAGARDYGKGQTINYYELSSGGFVPKEQLIVLESDLNAENRLEGASFAVDGRSETITLSGTGRPVYDTRIADNTFYLTLYNTVGGPGVNVSGSKLLSGAAVKEGERTVTYSFPLKTAVWGYGVAFDGNDLALRFQYKPASLSDMTILLDPGHGGADPGALGVAGTTGPDEADVNLAHALAARDALAGLGANVILTRADDSVLSLDDRLKLIEKHDADLFLSLHHNSVAESADANKIAGMEVYYHTPLSARSADNMMGGLATGLNRNNRAVKQSIYRVTLLPHAPALLLELGFMSSPLEYEKATTASEIQKVAAAIAGGVKRLVA